MGKDSIDAGSIVSVQSYGSVDAPHPNERRPKYGPVEREMREFNLDTAKRRWRERAGGSTAVRSLDEVRILAANQKRLNSSGRRVFDRIKAIWKKGPAARPEHLRAVYKRSPADQIAGRDLPQNAKNALTAKYMGAHRAATVSNASQFALGIATDRRASFKNLELFARHGQRLHSGDKASKLKATLSNIPKRVLDRASSQVDSDDYAKADVLRDDGSQRRLLSFGRFKFPSAAGGAFGAQAKAHRANLRALTASAFLLGGADAAQEVKAKLAVLNERGNNDAIMKNLLARLERHGSVEALMKDINTCLLESEAIKVRGDLGARGIEEGPGVAHIGREAFKAWSEINYGVGSPQSLDLVNRLDAVANSCDLLP